MKGCSKEAVEKAALIRLRPIIMTSAATIVAMIIYFSQMGQELSVGSVIG